jgi:hypothetical protein
MRRCLEFHWRSRPALFVVGGAAGLLRWAM